MNDPDSAAVADLATPAADLAQIAARRADLQARVAQHPNAYDGLLDWIAEFGSPEGRAAVSARRTPPPPVPRSAEAPVPPVPTAEAPEARKPRRGLVLGLVGAGLAVVLVGGGAIAWTVLAGAFGGAPDPRAAAERSLRAAAAGDALALLGSMAPSEVSALRPTFESLAAIRGDGDTDYMQLLGRIADAGEVRLDGLQYATDEIADGVTVVTAMSGTITIDGDPERLAEALADVSEQTTRAFLTGTSGYEAAQVETSLAEQRSSMASWLDEQLPFALDLAQAGADASGGLVDEYSPYSVVVVDEGGWYVSPLLSVAEWESRVSSYFAGVQDGRGSLREARGSSVPEPVSFATPEEAAAGAAQGFARAAKGDYAALAATLSLPERRLVALYGPVYADPSDMAEYSPVIDFTAVDVTSAVDGDRAELTLDDVALTSRDASGSGTGTFRLRGTCAEWSRSDGYAGWSSYSGCFAEWPGSTLLGFDQAKVVAVKENGGWLISPLQTAGDMAAQAAVRISNLSRDDRLHELWASS